MTSPHVAILCCILHLCACWPDEPGLTPEVSEQLFPMWVPLVGSQSIRDALHPLPCSLTSGKTCASLCCINLCACCGHERCPLHTCISRISTETHNKCLLNEWISLRKESSSSKKMGMTRSKRPLYLCRWSWFGRNLSPGLFLPTAYFHTEKIKEHKITASVLVIREVICLPTSH